MQNIDFHLAYLLTRHECVIIPGFGAFVVSYIPASKKKGSEVFCPPCQMLSFNSTIKHNDGLLANSLSLEKNISYKETGLIINQYVNHLNNQLNTGKTIVIQWIGNLSLSPENKIIFTPSARLSCNAFNYGFGNFYIPDIKELKSANETNSVKRNNDEVVTISVNRRALMWTGSVAAAVLALLLVSTPLNNHSGKNAQDASFIPIPVNKIESQGTTVEEQVIVIDNPLVSEPKPETIEIKPEMIQPANVRYYYIVIASLPAKNLAEKKLPDFQKAGFANAAIISREDKHRIYVNKFEDKKEAEVFLAEFRIKNPEFATAWLLSQRN
jgi:nucleoid DNA-binding protein